MLVMSLCIGPKIVLKLDDVLSDQGVSRTFDDDCLCVIFVCSMGELCNELRVFGFFVM